MACEDNIIGLSQTACNCYDTGKPVDFNTSKSGIFLDELEGLELDMLNASNDCNDGNIWSRMETATANALKALKTDVLTCASLRSDVIRKRFDGVIGQKSFTGALNITEDYAGMKFTVDWGQIRGGKLTIKAIATLMNTTTSFTVYLYSNESTTPLNSWVVNSTAGVKTNNDIVDFTVELESDDCDELEYYLIYDVGAFQPQNNLADCGCDKPRQAHYEKFVTVDGIVGTDLTDIEGWVQNGYANGLIVDICLLCSTSELICKGDDEMDFENDGWAMAFAWALRYRAGDILIDDLLSTGQINRFTMLPADRLLAKRNSYRREYSLRVDYLCENIDLTKNDCLLCSNSRMTMKGIKA